MISSWNILNYSFMKSSATDHHWENNTQGNQSMPPCVRDIDRVTRRCPTKRVETNGSRSRNIQLVCLNMIVIEIRLIQLDWHPSRSHRDTWDTVRGCDDGWLQMDAIGDSCINNVHQHVDRARMCRIEVEMHRLLSTQITSRQWLTGWLTDWSEVTIMPPFQIEIHLDIISTIDILDYWSLCIKRSMNQSSIALIPFFVVEHLTLSL